MTAPRMIAGHRSGGDPFPTASQAAEAGRFGWNLRCNRCGQYGAMWIAGMRPGWGDLALCDPHADELTVELNRHHDVMAMLTEVKFEQPSRCSHCQMPGEHKPNCRRRTA